MYISTGLDFCTIDLLVIVGNDMLQCASICFNMPQYVSICCKVLNLSNITENVIGNTENQMEFIGNPKKMHENLMQIKEDTKTSTPRDPDH